MSKSTPRLDRFLSALPDGLDSFSECQAKGSLVRSDLAGVDVSLFSGHLPPELDALVNAPPPVSVWMSEVHRLALHFATLDLKFSGDEHAMERFVFDGNNRVIRSPIYSALFRLLSFEKLFETSTMMWQQFHRGTTQEIRHFNRGEQTLVVVLKAPQALLEPLAARGKPALRALAIKGGAKDAVVTMVGVTKNEMQFRCAWV